METSFDQFWNLFDNKKSRDKCERKWHLMSAKDQQECMNSLPKYIASTPDRQYRKHPATYLNNKSWNDAIYHSKGEGNLVVAWAKPVKEFVEPKYKSATGQEMYEGMERIAIEKGEVMKVGDWSGAYLYAESEGLIDKLSNDEKQMYKDNVRADLKSEAVKSPKYQDLLNTLVNPKSLAVECRKRILITHFKKMIETRK